MGEPREPEDYFPHKVVGVTRTNQDGTSRQENILLLRIGQPIELRPEPDNPVDSNAIGVHAWPDGLQLGYLDARTAAEVSGQMRRGVGFSAWVQALIGGPRDDLPNLGVVISIARWWKEPGPPLGWSPMPPEKQKGWPDFSNEVATWRRRHGVPAHGKPALVTVEEPASPATPNPPAPSIWETMEIAAKETAPAVPPKPTDWKNRKSPCATGCGTFIRPGERCPKCHCQGSYLERLSE